MSTVCTRRHHAKERGYQNVLTGDDELAKGEDPAIDCPRKCSMKIRADSRGSWYHCSSWFLHLQLRKCPGSLSHRFLHFLPSLPPET